MNFLIVTGLSGAGKSMAVNALEDIGFFCIDNIPVALLPRIVDFALQGEVHDTRQQRHRDVVNAEKADVLQRVDSHRLARAGKAGHDQKIHLPHRSLILPREFRVPAQSRSWPQQLAGPARSVRPRRRRSRRRG